MCREPDEQEDAIKLLPEAVIEVVSKGYEAKDLELGPRFYISQGVKDVVGAERLVSPQPLSLECGCDVVV